MKKNIYRIIRIKNDDIKMLQSLCDLETHKMKRVVRPNQYIGMLIRKEADYAGEYAGQRDIYDEEDNVDVNGFQIGFVSKK